MRCPESDRGCDVACKSPSPICNGIGCLRSGPWSTSGPEGPPASGACCAAGSRSGSAAAGQPQRIVRRRPQSGARVFLRQATSRERANAVCLVGWQARRRSGQMSGHTTPQLSSVNRQYLRDCAGRPARPDFPSRYPVSIEPSLLQHAGSRRPMRGAPARGSGLSSAARRVVMTPAPMETSYGQQDAYRRHPPGRDPGRGGPRVACRGIRLRIRQPQAAPRQYLSRQGDAGRALAPGRLRRIWRQPPRLPRLLGNPPGLLPDPGRRPAGPARRGGPRRSRGRARRRASREARPPRPRPAWRARRARQEGRVGRDGDGRARGDGRGRRDRRQGSRDGQ